jgi:putative ABC transport system permease protein
MTQDIRLAVRRLLRYPGFTIVALLTLALGTGANTAIFSLVNGILLRPLPYRNPEQLVRVLPKNLYQKGVFLALRDKPKSLQIAAFTTDSGFNLTGSGEPARIEGSLVSAELFSVLGTNPQLGRVFQAGEDEAGRDQVVILSHALWQQYFSADPGIIGRTIVLDGENKQVVGVMAPEFHFPSNETRLWLPIHFDRRNWPDLWTLTPLRMIGRLRPGSNPAQASAELLQLLPQVKAMIPWSLPADWGENGAVVSLQELLVGDYKTRLWILMSAVGLVLLIACVNIANLLLARATMRQKEFAVYAALGASRWRIMRPLLLESLLLSIAGGLLGLALATGGLSLLIAALPADTPRLLDIVFDWRILGFTAGLVVFTGLVLGIVPALRAASPDVQPRLKEGGQRSSTQTGFKSLPSVLVMTELTLAVVLVISAVLLVKSFWRLSQVDPGFRTDHLLTFRVNPLESRCAEPARCLNFYDDLLARMRALPGIEDAAVINDLPLGETSTLIPLSIEGYPADKNTAPPEAQMYSITPTYLAVMKIPIRRGRAFTDADRSAGAGAGVVLVSESFAKHFWPGEEPVGKRIKAVFPKDWWTVVGVVEDMKNLGLAKGAGLQFYVPYGMFGTPAAMNVVVRTQGDPTSLMSGVRKVVADVDPSVPVSNVKTSEQIVSASVATPRLTMWLLVTFALLALILGAVGVYGVISYSVSRRRHEIGLRMALGAQQKDILRMIIWQSLVLTLVGIVVGSVAAFGVTRVLRNLLYQVSPVDPLAFVVVTVLLAGVTLVASYFPARRATRIDPLLALRSDT